MSVNTPHDHLFRFAFDDLDVARGELNAVLPPSVRDQLDLSGLTIEKTAFVDEDLSARFCDVLYRAPVRGGGEAFLWLLLEHLSRSDALIALRLLEYMSRVWSKWRRTVAAPGDKLPMIVPVVLQHDPTGWRAPQQFRALYAGPQPLVEALSPFIPDFFYLVDDLDLVDDETLAARSESPFLKLVLWSLRSRGAVDPRQLTAWTAAFRALWRSGKQDAAMAVVRYHVEVSEDPRPVALEAAKQADPDLERSCMTLSERLRREGQREGEAQGRRAGEAQGRREGQADALLKLIALKFGAPSSEVEARVRAASLEDLDGWIAVILTATSLDELFGS